MNSHDGQKYENNPQFDDYLGRGNGRFAKHAHLLEEPEENNAKEKLQASGKPSRQQC